MRPRIFTFTGREVNPLAVFPVDLNLRDMAHGLALVNRFGGHTKRPISVAQHSVYVWRLCRHTPTRVQRQALLHDCSEAYLGDVTKWLKMDPIMSGYRAHEEALQGTIYAKYGCETELHHAVELADRIMVRFEGGHPLGCGMEFAIDHPNYPPLTDAEREAVGPWVPWSWQHAEQEFLRVCDMLHITEDMA